VVAGITREAESGERDGNRERWPEEHIQGEGSSAAVAECPIARLPHLPAHAW